MRVVTGTRCNVEIKRNAEVLQFLGHLVRRQILFGITIPMMKDSIALVVMLQMIASFKLFGQTYLMSGGVPGTSTRTIVHYIYETGFTNRHMGSAAAMSVAFFAVVLAASLIQNRIFSKEG